MCCFKPQFFESASFFPALNLPARTSTIVLIIFHCGIRLLNCAGSEIGLDCDFLLGQKLHVGFEGLVSDQVNLDVMASGRNEHAAAWSAENCACGSFSRRIARIVFFPGSVTIFCDSSRYPV